MMTTTRFVSFSEQLYYDTNDAWKITNTHTQRERERERERRTDRQTDGRTGA